MEPRIRQEIPELTGLVFAGPRNASTRKEVWALKQLAGPMAWRVSAEIIVFLSTSQVVGAFGKAVGQVMGQLKGLCLAQTPRPNKRGKIGAIGPPGHIVTGWD